MLAEKINLANITKVLYLIFISVFILAPILVVIVISFNEVSFTKFPPIGFSLRWYEEVLTNAQWRKSFTDSLIIAAITSSLACVVGTLGAVGLHRSTFRGKDAITSIILAPIVLPGLITGLALLFFFARFGLTGTNVPLILGHLVITFPYVLRVVLGSLTRETRMLEEAAMTLGADELTTFLKVTLPLSKPGIIAGTIFAFIISFDNITISIFLASPRNVTLPIRIFEHIQWAGTPSVAAISSILVVLTFLLSLMVEKIFGMDKLLI